MKLLVTGGAGFIGSAVVRLAVARGHHVINLDALTYAACLENVACVADDPHYSFEHADIRDRPALERIFQSHQPDAVMHLAAESHVDRSIDGPGDFIETNITGTFNMLGRSKLAGEDAIRQSGCTHVILRTSWVFSAHGNNFVKTMLRLGTERDSLRVVADQVGGPTPATAIAAACLQIAEALRADPSKTGTYHFSGAPEISWAGFARAIMKEAGLGCRIEDITTAEYPTPAHRPLNSRLDCSALDIFGLQQPDWRAALKTVIQDLEGTP